MHLPPMPPLRAPLYRAIAFAVFAPVAAAALAQAAPVIYPAKGQTDSQVEKDKFECYQWAKAQSGFDPAQASQPAPMTAAAPSTAGKPSDSAALAGMAKGAAGGAAVAELADKDAGRGAAVGLVANTLREKLKQQQQQAAQGQATQAQMQQMQAQQARAQQRGAYDRAFGACLEGRGYVVR